MKRPAFLVACLLSIVAGACGGSAPPADQAASARRSQEAAPDAIDRNVVRVSDEMLRDLRVTTTRVEEHRGAEDASMLGELNVNDNQHAVVGSPLQARVIQLHVVQGQAVKTGAILATLQSGDLAKMRSDLGTADARVALARRVLERKRGLNAERIVPMREVQEAENELVAAEEQFRAAQSTIEALGASAQAATGLNASTLEIRAPIGGIILERHVVLGQVADAATPLFSIADLSTVWLTVHAFERDAVRVRVGEPARITFAAMPGRAFAGTVSLIGQSVDRESRTVPVRIDLPNREGLLRPGMSATAWLPVGDASGVMLTVPAAALQRVRDRWCVFVPKDESTFEIRAVGRGRDLAGEVEVVSGMRAGETVVVDGAFLLKAEAEKTADEHEEH